MAPSLKFDKKKLDTSRSSHEKNPVSKLKQTFSILNSKAAAAASGAGAAAGAATAGAAAGRGRGERNILAKFSNPFSCIKFAKKISRLHSPSVNRSEENSPALKFASKEIFSQV